MTIRDDRKKSLDCVEELAPAVTRHGYFPGRRYNPDAVLYDCPECGHAHFVTVDACPSWKQAAAEVAMVDGKKVE